MIRSHLFLYPVGWGVMILLLAQTVRAADPRRPIEGLLRPPEMQLTFSMDNTNVDIHRMSDSAGFEILIHGNVACTTPVIWNLSPSPYRSFGPADLLLVTNVMGTPVPQGNVVVPLRWELAVNGGAFTHLEYTPDFRLTWRFLPGVYAYTLRITGLPMPYQPPGHYQLHVSQYFLPQM